MSKAWYRPREKRPTKFLTVRIPVKTWTALEGVRHQVGIPVSEQVRRALTAWVEGEPWRQETVEDERTDSFE